MFSLHVCPNVIYFKHSYKIFDYSFVIRLFYSLAFKIFTLALLINQQHQVLIPKVYCDTQAKVL